MAIDVLQGTFVARPSSAAAGGRRLGRGALGRARVFFVLRCRPCRISRQAWWLALLSW